MRQPTNFMQAMRDLAENDRQRGEALSIGRRLAQNLREGKLPPLILRLCHRPALLVALLADAQAGNVPEDPRPRMRTPRASDKKPATKSRRHPKQSTVRL